jgi:LPS export ABC transporter protein LptC
MTSPAPIGHIVRLILLSAAILALGCGSEEKPQSIPQAGPSESAGPDQVTSNARIYMYSKGYKTTDLRADQIRQYTKLDSTIAIRLDADFFDSTGARVSTLTAKRGYIREKDNFLAVSDSVVVIGEDARLETQYLEWDAGKDRVVTDSFVTVIRGEGDTLRSVGVETDPRLHDITFKNMVSGRLTEVREPGKDGQK